YNELLEHAYRLCAIFIYNLYGFTINHLNITTRNPTDAYGVLYFKISNYTPYNHYVYKEGVYEKDHNLFNIIENNKIDSYYANKVFEYQIEYYAYKWNEYEKLLNLYAQDPNRNINYIEILNALIEQIEETISDTTIVDCYKKDITNPYVKKYRLCDKTILNDETIRKEYKNKIINPEDRIIKSTESPTINYVSNVPSNMYIVRFFDDAYKTYSFIAKEKNKHQYKLFKLNPKLHCDNYMDLLSQISLEKVIHNNNFTLYKGYILDKMNIYSDVYRVVKCDLPNLKLNKDNCYNIMKYDERFIDNINKVLVDFPRIKIYYNKRITDQLDYHFNYIVKNNIINSFVSTIPPFLQLIYLGLNENMLKLKNSFVFNNGKFIICPDPKWIEKLSSDQLKNIVQTYNKEAYIYTYHLPQIHYTAWYNPFTNNVKDGKFTILSENFQNLMKNINEQDTEYNYNIFRNVYKAYKEGVFEGTKNNSDIIERIIEYYKDESNLLPIFRKEHQPFFLNLTDPNILNQDIWNQNISSFMQNNELIRNKRLISYIHRGNDALTMILHIHLVFESLKYTEDINIGIYEQRYTSENMSDVFYNLALRPDYYRNGNYILLSKIMYSSFYVNITDHIDPLLFDYPIYPTFNLKIVKLNNKNIIYPNERVLYNKLGFDYDKFNKNKYIQSHDNPENTKPFTFNDWILNKKLRDIYKDKMALLDYFKYIENFGNHIEYISKLWEQNMSIRDFYVSFIQHYKEINNVYI
ncbi:MAG: hypothetical protein MUO21_09090, partial [Nitrososphaeraceae archaeon]|nr:hypothetical protein [Nitrososphaeraceae archaeon]